MRAFSRPSPKAPSATAKARMTRAAGAPDISFMRATNTGPARLITRLAKGGRNDGAEAVRLWMASKADALSRAKSFLDALERTGELSVAKLTLANSQIHELAGH